jgi:hypothetical protein
MKRRSFLRSATLAGAAGSLPVAFATAAMADPAAMPFRLLRAASAEPGATFQAPGEGPCDTCGEETLRVTIDGLHMTRDSRLRSLALSALFEQRRAPSAPFLAWHYAAGTPDRRSGRVSFVAGRATLRALQVDFQFDGENRCVQRCELTRFDSLLLAPGHYVLAGPATGSIAALVHSGDVRAPVAGADFDYLALRIQAA